MTHTTLLAGLAIWVLTCAALGITAKLLLDSTASATEIIWTGTALGGLVYAVRVLRRRRTIERERKRLGINGLLAIISSNYVRSRWIALAVQTLNLVAGLAAMAAPEPVRSQVTIYAAISSGSLMLVGLLTAFSSWQSERMLVAQLDYVFRHRRPETPGRKLIGLGYLYEREADGES